MYIVEVLVEHPVLSLDTTFSYLSYKELHDNIRVLIPFNHKKIVGYVVSCDYTSLTDEALEKRDGFKYLFIDEVIDCEPLLNDELVSLADTMSKLTISPKIACLQAMLPSSLKPTSTKQVSKKYEKFIEVISSNHAKTNKQNECLDYLRNLNKKVSIKEIPYSTTILENLEKQGLISINKEEVYRSIEVSNLVSKKEVQLTSLQQSVIDGILSSQNRVSLIHGVTGSGKTEVYLALTKEMIKRGKNVIMLVPEISLTPMMVSIFKQRFNDQVAILHSKLSNGERYDEYRKIKRQEVRIVVGARSAIFAPLDNIGMIILDEEHDASYKQESTPRYLTSQIAKIRCQTHHASLVLGSATPSLESYARAKKGIYDLYEMTKRINQNPMPHVEIVDMVKEMKAKNYSPFSKSFSEGLKECLDKNEQAMILINKRGYSTYVRCNSCKEPVTCPHCAISLTYHKVDNMLKCHYCDYSIKVPSSCPKCHGSVKLIGVGTQKIEEAIEKQFNTKVIRYDVDTTSRKNANSKLLEAFKNKQANVLVGTQMISKGLDFNDVTFVGVINADTSLNIPDYKSSERTFQLLTQVAGRSGRGDKVGKVVIQTFNPTHYAIEDASKHDYISFFNHEMLFRKLANYPPFTHIVTMVFSSKNQKVLIESCKQVEAYLKEHLEDCKILGPSECVIGKINDYYRQRITIKFTNSKPIYPILNKIAHRYKQGKVLLSIDFNPYSMM